MLKDLLAYTRNRNNSVWIAPSSEVVTFINNQRVTKK